MNLLKEIFKKNSQLANSAYLKVINKPEFNPEQLIKKINIKELNIKEKFVLHVDCDEYLIQNGPQKYQKPISELLDENDKDGMNLYWAVASSSSLKISKSFAVKWKEKKQIGRTYKITGFDGPHRFHYKESNRYTNSKNISETKISDSRLFNMYLAHLISRSINDTLIRVLAGDLKIKKINSLNKYLQDDELPPRLKGVCFFDLLEGNIRIIDASSQEFNHSLENKIIKKYVSKNNLEKTKELYFEYFFLLQKFQNKNPDFNYKKYISTNKFQNLLPEMSELRNSS